jgi:spore germination protein GerM
MKNSKNLIITGAFTVGIILAAIIFLTLSGDKLVDKNSITVYFVKNSKLIAVKRPFFSEDSKITTAITELLKGPSEREQKKGLYSEIPVKTKLLGIKETEGQIELNLSRDFESGGGSNSMILRLDQLTNTTLKAAPEKPVYLKLDGKIVKNIGGEGLYVPQPLAKTAESK